MTLDEAEAKAALAAAWASRCRAEWSPRRPTEAGDCSGRPGLPRRAEGPRHRPQERGRRGGARPADTESVVEAAERVPAPDGCSSSRWWAMRLARLIVGVTRDPAHGLVLTLGAGGVLVELLADSASLLAAGDGRDEIRAALASLKVYPLLTGCRGKPAGDLEAVDRCGRGRAALCGGARRPARRTRRQSADRAPARAPVAADALIRLAREND